jgi:putative ABC transport system permease protein
VGIEGIETFTGRLIAALSPALTATTAIRMPVAFAREDLSLGLWSVGLAMLVSILPALSTLRLSPARALRS